MWRKIQRRLKMETGKLVKMLSQLSLSKWMVVSIRVVPVKGSGRI